MDPRSIILLFDKLTIRIAKLRNESSDESECVRGFCRIERRCKQRQPNPLSCDQLRGDLNSFGEIYPMVHRSVYDIIYSYLLGLGNGFCSLFCDVCDTKEFSCNKCLVQSTTEWLKYLGEYYYICFGCFLHESVTEIEFFVVCPFGNTTSNSNSTGSPYSHGTEYLFFRSRLSTEYFSPKWLKWLSARVKQYDSLDYKLDRKPMRVDGPIRNTNKRFLEIRTGIPFRGFCKFPLLASS